MSELSKGEWVVFKDVHHSMNSELKKHYGEVGKVTGVDRGHEGGKVQVEFEENSFERYLVSRERVEKLGQSLQIVLDVVSRKIIECEEGLNDADFSDVNYWRDRVTRLESIRDEVLEETIEVE